MRPDILRSMCLRRIRVGLYAAILVVAGSCTPDGPVEGPDLLPGSEIEYPAAIWDREIDGDVVLMVHVTQDGAVDSVYVESGSGVPELDTAAVKGGRMMRFAPARRGENQIDAWTRVPVRFQHEPARAERPRPVSADSGQAGNG